MANGKSRSLDAVDLAQMRAEVLERAQVRAFSKQPDIHFAENGRKAVRVVKLLNAAWPFNAQTVVEALVAPDDGCFEESRGVAQSVDFALIEFNQYLARFSINCRH